jgi:hypothetical protein
MKRFVRVFLIAAMALAPTWAGAAWRAANRLEVLPVSDGVFEVIGQTGSSAGDYWCGAGDYARSKLRTGATQRVYLWRALGFSQSGKGRKAVQFSLAPPSDALTSPGYSLSVKAVGDNMTAAAAAQYCYSRITLDR